MSDENIARRIVFLDAEGIVADTDEMVNKLELTVLNDKEREVVLKIVLAIMDQSTMEIDCNELDVLKSLYARL